MNIPFSEMIEGLPVWRLQVDDPDHAVDARIELAFKPLLFPQGGVLGLCLKLFDRSDKPVYFHHAVAFGSLELGALRQHNAILLVFEHKGWNSDTRKALPTAFSTLAELPEGQDALAPYLELYRASQSGGGPEKTWASIEEKLKAPAPVQATALWVKVLWGLLVLAVVAAAYFLLPV